MIICQLSGAKGLNEPALNRNPLKIFETLCSFPKFFFSYFTNIFNILNPHFYANFIVFSDFFSDKNISTTFFIFISTFSSVETDTCANVIQ